MHRETRRSTLPRDQGIHYSKLGVPGVWSVRVEGGDETQVLDHGWMGHWALTDEGICLLDPGSMPPVIQLFSFGTRSMQQVAALPREGFPPEGFTRSAIGASPDGRSILYMQADQTESEIMLVGAFPRGV